MATLVFVYGTLCRGGRLHDFHMRTAEFIGRGRAYGFGMYDLGSFPAAVPVGNATWSLVGEVYAVDAKGLAALDQVEGVPRFYDRKPATIILDNGETCDAEVYFMPTSLDAKGHPRPRVAGGDWIAYVGDYVGSTDSPCYWP